MLVRDFSTQEELIVNNNIDILYSLIRDPDPVVSANSIMALDEILQEEGGIAINSKMIIYLLNRIKVK
jgi:hypothetical protein